MNAERRKELVVEALRGVIDPEVGVNVVDLGLVYDIDIIEADEVRVTLGVTTAACPLGQHLVELAESAIRAALPAVERIDVALTRDPPWSPDRMSAAAKDQLGWGC